MRRFGLAALIVVGAFFVLRAAVEPFAIEMGDPSTYSKDWGGPSLAGVLAVHMGPGLVSAVLLVIGWRRHRAARTPRS